MNIEPKNFRIKMNRNFKNFRNFKIKQKLRFYEIFCFLKLFEKIKTKPDLENKIYSNIDHRQSPVFYFKIPPRGHGHGDGKR